MELWEGGDAQLLAVLKKNKIKRLYGEDSMTLARHAALSTALAGVELVADGTLRETLAGLREVKDEGELARMQAAQQITDDCFAHILGFIKEGVREVELAQEMEYYMRSHGADGLAFDTICAAGKNSSLPHAVPGSYKLRHGDFITMDFGAKVKGYCTDMTRTVCLGAPDAEQRKVYDTVLRAQLAGLAAAAAGAETDEVDKAARDVIGQEGYGAYFGHGLGHAVGIEVHEGPRFSPKCHRRLRSGMMMTVEPGIYLPGRFGCRIEDTVRITEVGCEPLPASKKQLVVL